MTSLAVTCDLRQTPEEALVLPSSWFQSRSHQRKAVWGQTVFDSFGETSSAAEDQREEISRYRDL